MEVQTKGYLGATMAAPGRSQRKGTRIATLLALAAVLATANATVTSHEDQGRAALKALQHRAVLEQDNDEASEASLFQRFLRWKEPQGCWTAALENAQFEHSCDKIDSEQTRRLAFSFLVCHLEEVSLLPLLSFSLLTSLSFSQAGKSAPACRLEQQVKTCIQRLDTDSFGAWTQFRLSVLSICSMVRRDSAETRFFNLLLNSTKVLNEQMADLRSAQEEVADRIHALDTDVVAAHEQVEELAAELDDASARARAFFEDQKGIWQRVERVTSVWAAIAQFEHWGAVAVICFVALGGIRSNIRLVAYCLLVYEGIRFAAGKSCSGKALLGSITILALTYSTGSCAGQPVARELRELHREVHELRDQVSRLVSTSLGARSAVSFAHSGTARRTRASTRSSARIRRAK